jgi:electron transport complex protein RnfB
MEENPYKRLAERLDALPNGFPPTEEGVELQLLAKIFTPEEAALASQLRLTQETSEKIAGRIGGDPKELSRQLKRMARKGLITAGRTREGLGYGLMPFVVGIYEMQIGNMDAELARLFEDYYMKVFGQVLTMKPSYHRVIPVNETVRMDIEVHPFESAADILSEAKAWGVLDCICRKQKELIGDPCEHPVDVCMVLSQMPGAFANNPVITKVTCEEAMATLQRAADAGLVHTVSNKQKGMSYICNCCTCSCGILRGIADLGIANAVAWSGFVNQVDEELCVGCDLCIEHCQFDALSLDGVVRVDRMRCVGCGVCVPFCPEDALSLVRRPAEEVEPIPASMDDWLNERAAERGLNLEEVL